MYLQHRVWAGMFRLSKCSSRPQLGRHAVHARLRGSMACSSGSQEEVDHIQVNGDGRPYVVVQVCSSAQRNVGLAHSIISMQRCAGVLTKALDEELGVKGYVGREQDGSQQTVYGPAVRKQRRACKPWQRSHVVLAGAGWQQPHNPPADWSWREEDLNEPPHHHCLQIV